MTNRLGSTCTEKTRWGSSRQRLGVGDEPSTPAPDPEKPEPEKPEEPAQNSKCLSQGPASASESDLKAYALLCGKEATISWLAGETGANPQVLAAAASGDWKAAAKEAALYEFGDAAFDPNIFNDDGSLNYSTIAGDAGGVAAAVICTAYGAGAVAPVCSIVGSEVGKFAYDLGKAAVGVAKDILHDFGIGSDDKVPAYLPDVDTSIGVVIRWYLAAWPGYLLNIYAMREIAVMQLDTAKLLSKLWNVTFLGQASLTPEQMLSKMVSGGLKMPPGYKTLLPIPHYSENHGILFADTFTTYAGDPLGLPRIEFSGADLAWIAFGNWKEKNKNRRDVYADLPPTTAGSQYRDLFLFTDDNGQPFITHTQGGVAVGEVLPGDSYDWVPEMGAAHAATGYVRNYFDPQVDELARGSAAYVALSRSVWLSSLDTAVAKVRSEVRAGKRQGLRRQAATPSSGAAVVTLGVVLAGLWALYRKAHDLPILPSSR